MQTEMDFITHAVENNPDSQSYLRENVIKLSNECQKVFNKLEQGDKLTVKECMLNNITSSLPRRILDLKQQGIEVRDSWVLINGKRAYKEYYL